VGQCEDPETNLSYLQARYYDGSKGAFLSEDPVFLGHSKQQVLADPQSLNSYSTFPFAARRTLRARAGRASCRCSRRECIL
jgi:RHS repeat-associated protein